LHVLKAKARINLVLVMVFLLAISTVMAHQ
jgi:hypothetical protein